MQQKQICVTSTIETYNKTFCFVWKYVHQRGNISVSENMWVESISEGRRLAVACVLRPRPTATLPRRASW